MKTQFKHYDVVAKLGRDDMGMVSNIRTPSASAAWVLTRTAVRQRRVLAWASTAILILSLVNTAYAFHQQIPMLQALTNSVTPAATGNVIATATAGGSTNIALTNSMALARAPDATGGSIATTASSAEPDNSKVEATDNASAAQERSNTPVVPIAPAPKPHLPTIAVISGGDSAVAEPAEQIVLENLKRLGFHVIDEAALPRVSQMLDGEQPEYANILQTLERAGKVDAVVFVHARPVGSQEITYSGQNSTLYTAQIAIRAYRVSGKVIGSGWSEKVMFTTLNAADKVREAIEPLMGEVVGSLREFRIRHHGHR